jgi:hypothetical protein
LNIPVRNISASWGFSVVMAWSRVQQALPAKRLHRPPHPTIPIEKNFAISLLIKIIILWLEKDKYSDSISSKKGTLKSVQSQANQSDECRESSSHLVGHAK